MIEVVQVFRGVEAIGRRQLNNAIRSSMMELGDEWNDRYLRKHFTKAGASLYGYAPRSGEAGSGRPFKGSYTARKIKEHGHAKPLVKTGEMENDAIANKSVKASAKGGEGFAAVRLPRKANFRNPNSKTNPLEELRTVSRGEKTVLENTYARRLDQEINDPSITKTVRIGTV